MKKLFLIYLYFVFAIPLTFAGDKTILVATSDVPPFSGETLKDKGVSIKIISEAFKRVGYSTKIQFYPWKRALEMTKQGRFDGIAPIWYTKERTQWYAYSHRLYTPSLMGVFSKQGHGISVNGYEDLKPYHLGYVLGFAYSPVFYDNLPEFTAAYYYTPLELMGALVKGKIEIAIMGKHQGDFLLTQNFPGSKNKYKFMEPVIETRTHHLAMSKKTENYKTKLADFNKGLSMILRDGRLKKILAEYDMAEP